MRLISLVLFLLMSLKTLGQSSFRSVRSGNWSDAATWESLSGGSWSQARSAPVPNIDSIIIRGADTVSIHGMVSVNGIIVRGTLWVEGAGSILSPTTGRFMEVVAGGSVLNNGTIVGDMNLIIFRTGARYRHLHTNAEGAIPRATWESGSVLEIAGFTSWGQATATGNWDQSFADVEWNTAGLSTDFILNGLLKTIRGDFRILNTGNAILRLSWAENASISIGRDMEVRGGRFSASKTGQVNSLVNVDIGRDLIFNAPSPLGSRICEQGVSAFRVARHFRMDAGLLYFSSGSGGSSNSGGDLRVAGDFLLNGGVLDASIAYSNRVGDLFFTGTAEQLFFNRGSIIGSFNYRLGAGTKVRIPNGHFMTGNNLEVGDLTGGATLLVMSTDPAGAIQKTISGTGNLRVRTQTWRPGSAVIYAGDRPQFIGSDHPSGSGITTVMRNPVGVSVSAVGTSVVCGGDLVMEAGDLTVLANNLTIRKDLRTTGGRVIVSAVGLSSSRTLTVDGAINLSGPDLIVDSDPVNNSGNAVLVVNGDFTGTGMMEFSGGNCQVQVGGVARTFTRPFPVAGPFSLESLTISAPVTLRIDKDLTLGNYTASSGSWTGGIFLNGGNLKMDAGLIVTTVASLVSGVLDFSGQTVELQRNIQTTWPTGVFAADSLSEMRITSAFAGTDNTISFKPDRSRLGRLVLNRTANVQAVGGQPVTPHIRLNIPLTITGELVLEDGEFYHESGLSMASGSRIIRTTEAAFSPSTIVSPAGGPYDLIYRDGKSLVDIGSGIEALGKLGMIGVSVTKRVVISESLRSAGWLNILSGTADLVTSAVSVDSVINIGTLLAPPQLTVRGRFRNDGNFLHRSGAVHFGNDGRLEGAAETIFHHLHINGRLELGRDVSIQGDLENHGYLIPYENRMNFSGGTGQRMAGTMPLDVHHLTISNTRDTVNALVPIRLTGVLDVQSGAHLNVGDAGLTLRSTAQDKVGRVGPLDERATINGTVIQERYMSPRYAYRYIAQPFSGVTFNDIASGFPWSPGYLFRYDETVLGYKDYGWSGMSGNDHMEPGTGYIAWPSRAAYSWPVVWRSAGKLEFGINRDMVKFRVRHTASPEPKFSNDGWNLLGNPYPSPVKWSLDPDQWSDGDGGSMKNIHPVLLMRNPETGGVLSYNPLTGLGDISGGTGIIASGQAFWVHTTGPDPRLAVHEAAKATEGGRYYRSTVSGPPALQVSVTDIDRTASAFLIDPSEMNGLRSESMEAIQLPDTLFSVSLVSSTGVAFVHRVFSEVSAFVPVRPASLRGKTFRLSIRPLNGFNADGFAILDSWKGEVHPILFGDTLSLASAGAGQDRYVLGKTDELRQRTFKNIARLYPNPNNGTFRISAIEPGNYALSVTSLKGETVHRSDEVVEGAGEVEVRTGLHEGQYVVTLTGGNRRYTLRLLIR